MRDDVLCRLRVPQGLWVLEMRLSRHDVRKRVLVAARNRLAMPRRHCDYLLDAEEDGFADGSSLRSASPPPILPWNCGAREAYMHGYASGLACSLGKPRLVEKSDQDRQDPSG